MRQHITTLAMVVCLGLAGFLQACRVEEVRPTPPALEDVYATAKVHIEELQATIAAMSTPTPTLTPTK